MLQKRIIESNALRRSLAQCGSRVNQYGMIYKVISFWIFASFLLAACAGEVSRRDAATQTPADNQPAQPRQGAYPTFTYRPGS
jgi:hypothetical protein